MEPYELSQVLMSVATFYEVRRPGEDRVLFTVRGELMSPSPAFKLLEPPSNDAVAQLAGNFIKTKYEVEGKGGDVLARLVFPAVAFKKTLSLTVGDAKYEADGGVFRGVFQCKDDKGEVVLEISKESGIRDRFAVKMDDAFPREVGLLCAVAIHSRFYEIV
ncbi:MAG: hypothetical protein KC657_15350 [Myxococcales bacterium]|nr:hypothetical protein [Myxococcales bacterium]